MSDKTPPQTVIIGLGETGFTCVEYCVQHHIPIAVIDTRLTPPKLDQVKQQYPTVPLYLGGMPQDILSKATTLILSPGIPKDHPDIQSALSPQAEIIGDIELFARNRKAPVIAITGSNGKSTVTTLVGEMAKKAGIRVSVGGNLGTPALALLKENPDLYVLELSSFQLETTYSLKPLVATILNLCPDHMDRYPNFEAYQTAKQRIYQHCAEAIYNREDLLTREGIATGVKIHSFGLNIPPDENAYGLLQVNDTLWLSKGKKPFMPRLNVKLFGKHNVSNALAACALSEVYGITQEEMCEVLETFPGLPHRCEWVKTDQNIQWINDSKGTNVGATVAALQGLACDIPGKWVLIAGGVPKNADFTPLRAAVEKYCRGVVLIGEAAEELNALLDKSLPCVRANSMEEAVHKASQLAQSGDGVLLSPACASFDMFKNFEHRGEVFKSIVKMGSDLELGHCVF